MPGGIDWDGMAQYLGYNSVKCMLEGEIAGDHADTYQGKGLNGKMLAEKLGVSDVSLYNKMRELGVSAPPRGRTYYFFPERFGYPSEKAMFQCLRFDEQMTIEQIVELLRTKITEIPVRTQTVKARLTKYQCFGGALNGKRWKEAERGKDRILLEQERRRRNV